LTRKKRIRLDKPGGLPVLILDSILTRNHRIRLQGLFQIPLAVIDAISSGDDRIRLDRCRTFVPCGTKSGEGNENAKQKSHCPPFHISA
jgi:hypothetical protein